jgi:hypothetical protein
MMDRELRAATDAVPPCHDESRPMTRSDERDAAMTTTITELGSHSVRETRRRRSWKVLVDKLMVLRSNVSMQLGPDREREIGRWSGTRC